MFRPDAAKANGVGVIVCPGGGWRVLAWEHEGIDLARWLTGARLHGLPAEIPGAGHAGRPGRIRPAVATMAARLPAPIPGRQGAARAWPS